MPTTPNITQVAEEHAQLQQNIANFDHAPAELHETADLLESVEKDLKVRESRMAKLIEKRKSEHKDLEKLQRSGTKRLFIRMKHGGKEGLERKLEKEEREYIEAAQDEHNESLAIAELKAAADNARLKKADLESQVMLRKEMLERLDNLYESAFDGPSPDFPEEDAAENDLKEAEAHFELVQAQLSLEKNVFGILDQAATCANQTQSALQSANLAATYDTFAIGGGIWAQMAEADDLIRAQTLAAQAQRLLERARGLQPLVKSVAPGKIVSPEWLNVVFDNMYTDFMFQQKIKQSIESVRKYQEGIYAECAASEERVKNLTQDAKDAREFLKSRRRQLVATRREILARIREDGGVRVFTDPDAREGSSGIPQLPTYAQQPEEGATVLATGGPRGTISMPDPVHEDPSMPPRYNSQPDSLPSLPSAETSQLTTPQSPPPGHTGSISTRSYAPPSGPPLPPRASQMSSYIGPSSELRIPEASISLRNTSDEGPRQPALNDNEGDRDNPPSRPRFASNNPFRTAL